MAEESPKKELDAMFVAKLGLHVATTLCIAIPSAVMYFDKPDNDKLVILDTILATLLMVATANALLSLLNFVVELINMKGEKLKNRVLNSARNIMTTLSLILGCIVFGLQTEAGSWLILFAVGIQRILDAMLDIGGLAWEVQCPEDDDKATGKIGQNGSKLLVALFALLSLGTAIGLLIWYLLDVGITFDSQSDDDIMLLISAVALSLHEVLIVLTVLFQFETVSNGVLKCLGFRSDKCDVSIHSINEIPLISVLVFTYNLLALSIVVGERMEENVSVNLLGSMIAIVSVAELAGRRMI